jgi:hypothetical protein
MDFTITGRRSCARNAHYSRYYATSKRSSSSCGYDWTRDWYCTNEIFLGGSYLPSCIWYVHAYLEYPSLQKLTRYLENTLFVGCRYEHKDYYYRSQWEGYSKNHQLELHTAFSRDQESKVYVQDQISKQATALWHLIDEQKAKILLSGSSNKMPEQIAFTFKQIFIDQGGLDAEQAEAYFNRMEKTGQFQQECWA